MKKWTFELTEEQSEKANAWMKEKSADKAYTGAIGGRFSFTFTVTSIGVAVSVEDCVTEESLDLTDYHLW